MAQPNGNSKQDVVDARPADQPAAKDADAAGLASPPPHPDAPAADQPAAKATAPASPPANANARPEDHDADLAPDGDAEAKTAAPGGEPGKETRPGFLKRHPLWSLLALLLFIAAAGAGYLYWDNAQHFETTDDAFIASRPLAIAPKVSGYISAVLVTDNQHVNAGDVIARIDDRYFRVALEQAEAQVRVTGANIQNFDAQSTVQQATVNSTQAQVTQTQAALVFAQQLASAYQYLAETGTGTLQNAAQFNSQLHQQEAAVATAQANLTAAQRQLATLAAQRKSGEAAQAQAAAQRDQAELNLSYTTITAAQAGKVASLTAAVGAYVVAGTALTMFVPDEIWVTANFKETQLDAMRPGELVTLRIDAYPERSIRGHVASVQPGSGTAFALLPVENATGNFIKIVQRVPVKLIMDNPPTDVTLGPGMSVVPTVRVDSRPSLYERARNWLWPP